MALSAVLFFGSSLAHAGAFDFMNIRVGTTSLSAMPIPQETKDVLAESVFLRLAEAYPLLRDLPGELLRKVIRIQFDFTDPMFKANFSGKGPDRFLRLRYDAVARLELLNNGKVVRAFALPNGTIRFHASLKFPNLGLNAKQLAKLQKPADQAIPNLPRLTPPDLFSNKTALRNYLARIVDGVEYEGTSPTVTAAWADVVEQFKNWDVTPILGNRFAEQMSEKFLDNTDIYANLMPKPADEFLKRAIPEIGLYFEDRSLGLKYSRMAPQEASAELRIEIEVLTERLSRLKLSHQTEVVEQSEELTKLQADREAAAIALSQAKAEQQAARGETKRIREQAEAANASTTKLLEVLKPSAPSSAKIRRGGIRVHFDRAQAKGLADVDALASFLDSNLPHEIALEYQVQNKHRNPKLPVDLYVNLKTVQKVPRYATTRIGAVVSRANVFQRAQLVEFGLEAHFQYEGGSVAVPVYGDLVLRHEAGRWGFEHGAGQLMGFAQIMASEEEDITESLRASDAYRGRLLDALSQLAQLPLPERQAAFQRLDQGFQQLIVGTLSSAGSDVPQLEEGDVCRVGLLGPGSGS